MFGEELVLACTGVLGHRGPNARGVRTGRGFAFGHTRLAIIDLDHRADQPFEDPATGATITYNGEIYNHRELREELESSGYTFVTRSDTEVLLRVLLHWGEPGLSRLNGMFAFALHDPKSKQTLLVRDRIGVKPLYYVERPEGVLFASQLSALLAWPGVSSRADPIGISSFLSYRSVIGERTLIQGIRKLEPGRLARIRNGRLTIQRWWKPSVGFKEHGQRTEPEEIRFLIGDAVSQQLEADVPVATLLSGGLDSSILAYEISARSSRKVTCFSAAVPFAGYNETSFAREVAQHLDLPHRVVDISCPTDIGAVSDLIRLRGHPLGMHNETAMYALAREVALEQKVVLSGEGADEIFAGYSRIFRLPFDKKRAAFLSRFPVSIRGPLASYWELPIHQLDDMEMFLSRYSYFPLEEKLGLATSGWRRDMDEDSELNHHFAREFSESGDSLFDRISNVFIGTHLPALLEMVDNTTMAAGLEARVPFTDHRLVEASLRLPPANKLAWKSVLAGLGAFLAPVSSFSERLDTSKVVLRELYRDVLPNSVINRSKMGFPLPLGEWASTDASLPFRNLLFGKAAPAVADYIDLGKLRQWYERRGTTPDDAFGKQLWLICNLEIFLRQLTSNSSFTLGEFYNDKRIRAW